MRDCDRRKMRKRELVFTKCQLSVRHTRFADTVLSPLRVKHLSEGEEKGFGAVYAVSFTAGS